MEENSVYKCKNLFECSYLMTRGFGLIGKERIDDKVMLIFKDSEEIQEAILKFYNSEGAVSAKKFSDTYRSLKDFIFER
jgi:hypothetical protein